MTSAMAEGPRPSVITKRDVRAEFPALAQEVHGHPLVYLDSAATALKPQSVIDAVSSMYAQDCANIHRGVHTLSMRATQRYEAARQRIHAFLGAAASDSVVFVRGATEGINLVAQSWARPRLGSGDEIVITGLEHHSNIVPWQIVCQQTGARLRVVPVTDEGEVDLSALEETLSERTRLLALAHASNSLGTVLPVAEAVALAHARGASVLVDGAQSAPHMPVSLEALGADFFVCSGHKMYGPSGIGVVVAKRSLLEEMEPYQAGGDMILSVTFEKTIYNEVPHRFEAGTPHIAGAVGLAAACDYVDSIGREAIAARESELLALGTQRLLELNGVRIVGTAAHKIGVLSFVVEGVHPHDLGTIADGEGVAIRTGHHCTQPLMERFGVPATARASLGLYNDESDLRALVRAVKRAQEMFC